MDKLDEFLDQFYGKYSPNDIPQGDRRARLKQALTDDFDGTVSQMYSKYSPDNIPDADRIGRLRGTYIVPQEHGEQPTTTAEEPPSVPIANTGIDTDTPFVGPALTKLTSTLTKGIPGGFAKAAAGSSRPDTYDEYAAKGTNYFPTKEQLKGLSQKEAEDEFGASGGDWVKTHIRKLIGLPEEELTFKKILAKAYEIAGPDASEKEVHAALDSAYKIQKDAMKNSMLDYSDKQQADAQVMDQRVIGDVDNIHSLKDFLNYAGGTAGQTAAYFALAPLGLAGLVASEKGEGFGDAISEIEKATGLTRQEIIAKGLDKKAETTSDISGTVNGALESAGELLVIGRLLPKKVVGEALTNILKKAGKVGGSLLIAGGEGLTELLQQLDTTLGSRIAAGQIPGQALSSITWNDLKNDFYGGLVGGGILGGVPHVIKSIHEGSLNPPEGDLGKSKVDAVDEEAQSLLQSATTGDPNMDASLDDLVKESAAYTDHVARETEKMEGLKADEELEAALKKADDAVAEAKRSAEQQFRAQTFENFEGAPTAEARIPEHPASEENELGPQVDQVPVKTAVKLNPLPVKFETKDRTIPILDDLTDKKIGEKTVQDFDYSDEFGGTASGTIHKGVASINSIYSTPNEMKYTPQEQEFKRRGFYEKVLGELKSRGITEVRVPLQSHDSMAALKRLVEKGVLKNPRDIAGSSGNEHPTRFDIGKLKTNKKNDTQNISGVQSPVGTREEPVSPEPVTRRGRKKAERSRVLQAQPSKENTKKEEVAKPYKAYLIWDESNEDEEHRFATKAELEEFLKTSPVVESATAVRASKDLKDGTSEGVQSKYIREGHKQENTQKEEVKEGQKRDLVKEAEQRETARVAKEKEDFEAQEVRYNERLATAKKSAPYRRIAVYEKIEKQAEESGHDTVLKNVQKLIETHNEEIALKAEKKELKETKQVKKETEARKAEEKLSEENAKGVATKLLDEQITYKGKTATIKAHRERLLHKAAIESQKTTAEDKSNLTAAIEEYKQFRKEANEQLAANNAEEGGAEGQERKLPAQSDEKIRQLIQNEERQRLAKKAIDSEKLDKRRANKKAIRDSEAEFELKRAMAKEFGISESELPSEHGTSEEDQLNFAGKGFTKEDFQKLKKTEISEEEFHNLAPSAQKGILKALSGIINKYKGKEKSNTRFFKYTVEKGSDFETAGFHYSQAANDNSVIGILVNEFGDVVGQEGGKNVVLHEYLHEYTKLMFHRLFANNKNFRKEVTKVFDNTKSEIRSQLKDIISRVKKGKEITLEEENLVDFAMGPMQENSANPIISRDLMTHESAGEIADNIIKAIYAFENVHEFMAEAFSDPHTAFFLSQIKTKERISEGLNKGKEKSLLYKWYETLSKFVNQNFAYLDRGARSEFKSVMDRLLDVVSEFDSEFVNGELLRNPDYGIFEGVKGAEKTFGDVGNFSLAKLKSIIKATNSKVVKNISSTLDRRKEIESYNDVKEYVNRVNGHLDKTKQLGDTYAAAIWKRIEKARKVRKQLVGFSKYFLDYARNRPEYKNPLAEGGSMAFRNLVDDFSLVDVSTLPYSNSDGASKITNYAQGLVQLAVNGIPTKESYDVMINYGKKADIKRAMLPIAPKLNQTFLGLIKSLANPTTFAHILAKYDEKLAQIVYAKMYGGIVRANSNAMTEAQRFAGDLSDTSDKLNLGHKDLSKIAMYGSIFSTETDPAKVDEWKEEIEKNADNLVLAAEAKLEDKNNNDYRRELSKSQIEDELTLAKELAVQVKKNLSMDGILTPKQKIIYDKVRAFSDKNQKDFERNSIGLWGNKSYVHRFNHFPTQAQGRLDRFTKNKQNSLIRDKESNLFTALGKDNKKLQKLYAKQSRSQFRRVNPKGYYYNFDTISLVQQWSKNMLYDIYASPELKTMNRLLQDPQFIAAFNKKTRDSFKHQWTSQADGGNKYDASTWLTTSWIGRQFTGAADAIYATHLTTSGQFLTQMSSGVVGAAVLSARLNPIKSAVNFAKAVTTANKVMLGNPGTNKIMKALEKEGLGIAVRDIRYELHLSGQEFTSGITRKTKSIVNKIEENINAKPLTYGDKLAAQLVWWASFFDAGGELNNFTRHHIDVAENNVGVLQNMSDMAFSPTAFKYNQVWQKMVMGMFYAFHAFSTNNLLNLVYSAKNLHNKPKARKVFAAAATSAIASQALMQLVTRPFYTAVLHSALKAVGLGGDDDDDEEKKRVSPLNEILTEAAWTATIGTAAPAFVDGMLRYEFNELMKPVYTPQFEEYNQYLDSPLFSAKNPVDIFKTAYGPGYGEIIGAGVTALQLQSAHARAQEFLNAGEIDKVEAKEFEATIYEMQLAGTLIGTFHGAPFRGDIVKLLRQYIREEKGRKAREKKAGVGASSTGEGEEGYFQPDLSQEETIPESTDNIQNEDNP